MRCRRVRSYLSAYCNGELSGRSLLAVDEHLADCPECRQEETAYRTISLAGQNLSGFEPSADFNQKLLNRIAKERFAETRTRAYLPRRAPLVAWGKVIPALVSAAVVLFVGIATLQTDHEASPEYTASSSSDRNYLTAQPTNNPNMTANLHQDWSLSEQMARAERISRISHRITPAGSFSSGNNLNHLAGSLRRTARPVPFVIDIHQIRPIVRIYQSTRGIQVKEEMDTF